jgi:NAD(P)-dependent dehydrogenase (short-subunit alcohol dehydrogenase family)
MKESWCAMGKIEGVDPVAVVTGAGQGMGRAIALKLAANGVHLVLVGRTRAKLDRVAAEIEALEGSPTVVALDVAVSQQVQGLRATLEDAFPKVDMVIHCAGEAFISALEDTTEADWDRLLAVNLKGPFLITQALLPLLRQSENASIVMLVSKVALKGYGTVTAYSAAKTGLLGFTRSLAAELRDEEIRVVALCPGPVDTPMRWQATPDYERKLVIDANTVASTVWHVVTLPRGVTMGEILLESVHYD